MPHKVKKRVKYTNSIENRDLIKKLLENKNVDNGPFEKILNPFMWPSTFFGFKIKNDFFKKKIVSYILSRPFEMKELLVLYI